MGAGLRLDALLPLQPEAHCLPARAVRGRAQGSSEFLLLPAEELGELAKLFTGGL